MRWNDHGIHHAITAAHQSGWPPDRTSTALLAIAADPTTLSPLRLPEAGPWRDTPVNATPVSDDANVVAARAVLAESGGARVTLQARARQILTASGWPVDQASVAVTALGLVTADGRAQPATRI